LLRAAGLPKGGRGYEGVAGSAPFIVSGASRGRRSASEPYFPNCAAARAAGAAPLYRGAPGYRPQLDGDDDGVACEPYRRR
jgi:hypothetical protein